MYTDPGSGLFFLQVAVAAFLTVAYRFRRAISQLINFRKSTDRKSGD